MRFNYSKLAGKIKERFTTQAAFAKAIKLSERTLSLKINGKIGWKQKEILKCCEALDIDVLDIPVYFFTPGAQHFEQDSINQETA